MFSVLPFDTILRIIFILLTGLYVVFAVVVTRQIDIMKKTLITPFSSVVTIIGYVHLAVALVIWLGFLFFL